MAPRSFAAISGILFVWTCCPDVTLSAASRHFTSPPLRQSAGTDSPCPVTQPNGKRYTAQPNDRDASGGNHGNEALVTWLWPEGKVVFKPGGSGSVLSDGALSMKFGWWRLRRDRLTLDGRRLDGPAPPMRARIPAGYGDIGFQSTALIFPTPGCWEVTGRVADGSLTFITLVEKIGEGPARLDSR